MYGKTKEGFWKFAHDKKKRNEALQLSLGTTSRYIMQDKEDLEDK